MASLVCQSGLYSLEFYSADRSPARKRVPLRVRVKRDAEQIRRKLERDASLGMFDAWTDDPRTYDAPAKPKPERLSDARTAFLATKTHMTPRTLGEYEQVSARFTAHAGPGTLVRDLTAGHVERWLDSTTAGDVTRRTYTRTLKVFFRWAVKEGLAETVATEAVKLRRVPSKFPRYLTEAEVESIVETVRGASRQVHWLADLVLLGVHTGLRRGELINLTFDAIDLPSRVLTVACTDTFQTKSGHERKVPLSAKAADVLARRAVEADSAGYVFTSRTGGQLEDSYVTRAFKRYVRKAGIGDVHLHHLRHTACSWLAMRGVPIEVIRQFAGHSSVTVTEKYMHAGPDVYAAQILRAFA